MKRRVGTGLEGDVAFGVKDESAHIGDDGAAVGQEHAEDQTDEGLAAVGQVVEGLAVLDLPEGDAVGGDRPFNVAVDLDADRVAGGVVQNLDGLYAADLEEDVEAAGGVGTLVDEGVLMGDPKVSGGVASAAVGASTARAAAMPMTMSLRIGAPSRQGPIGAAVELAP
jgi:hypothetical protein